MSYHDDQRRGPRRALSAGSAASFLGVGSIASIVSVGSIASLGSIGSIASIGSVGSIASTGKVGAIFNIPVGERLATWGVDRLTRRLQRR
jgi:hypothetical protein